MDRALTIDELAAEIRSVTSDSDARAVVNSASRVANEPHNRALQRDALLRVCAELAAEVIASRALRP